MWFHLNGELFWLATIPYWVILGTAISIRKRRGLGVYLAVASVFLFLLSDIVHWVIYQRTSIPHSVTWQEGGVFFYGLAMTLYQVFPMGLLYLFCRCSDTAVKKQGYMIRGRFNPHALEEHRGKRWVTLSALSFILPLGLISGPLGVTHTWWRMHQMDMGRVNPRGRGLLALAQVIFAMSWLSGYFLLAVAICGFQFYSSEILELLGYGPVLSPFWDVCIYYFPSALMAISFWLAMVAVAIYRGSYSRTKMIVQVFAVVAICGGIFWQVVSSLHGDTHLSPAVDIPMPGVWAVIAGWGGWIIGLAGSHQLPHIWAPGLESRH